MVFIPAGDARMLAALLRYVVFYFVSSLQPIFNFINLFSVVFFFFACLSLALSQQDGVGGG